MDRRIVLIGLLVLTGLAGSALGGTYGGGSGPSEGDNERRTETQKVVDVNDLRQSFLELYGNDFAFVDDWLVGTHMWILVVKPCSTGQKSIRYEVEKRYDHYDIKYTFTLTVGNKRSSRIHSLDFIGDRQYFLPDLRLGDSIVLPIRISPEHEQYRFIPTRQEARGQGTFWNASIRKHKNVLKGLKNELDSINPVEKYLSYMGTRRGRNFFRTGDFCPHLVAVFQAQKPGKFNLHIYGKGYKDQRKVLPVQIIPTTNSLRVLACYKSIRERIGKNAASSHRSFFRRADITLRVGDKIEVIYWMGDYTRKSISMESILFPQLTVEKMPYRKRRNDFRIKGTEQ